MLGTIMAANVFFNIIPAHWELINAKKAGREPDPTPGIIAKQRSVHNNYFTLPVLFTMLAGHFAFVYGAGRAWLVLIAIMLLGALARRVLQPAPPGPHDLGHPGGRRRRRPPARLGASSPDDAGERRHHDGHRLRTGCAGDRAALRPVPRAELRPSPASRARRPGSSSRRPSRSRRGRTRSRRVVSTKAMPLGNLTGMTSEERALVVAWVTQGASTAK